MTTKDDTSNDIKSAIDIQWLMGRDYSDTRDGLCSKNFNSFAIKHTQKIIKLSSHLRLVLLKNFQYIKHTNFPFEKKVCIA